MKAMTDDWTLLKTYAREHSHEAFAALAAKYADMVFSTAYRRTGRSDLAEDVTQAVFIALARSAHRLRPNGSLGGWLHRTALNASHNALRSESRRRRHERSAARSEAVAVPAPHDADEIKLIERAMHRMRRKDQQVLCLHYIEQRQVAEISKALRLTPQATQKRLDRALQRLRRKVSRDSIGAGAVVSALGAIGAHGAHASAAKITSTAVAGGDNGRAFILASRILRSFRLAAAAKAAAAVGLAIVLTGAVATIASNAKRTPAAAGAASATTRFSPPATAAAEAPLAQGTLSGTVVDPAGKPLAGASIIMQTYGDYGGENKTAAQAITAADGRFHLGPIDPVYRYPFNLLIEADGFAGAYVRGGSYSVFPGGDSDLGRVRVDRGRVFSGQVLDLNGVPRPNATVECSGRRYFIGVVGEQPITPVYKLTTDGQGRFRTPPMPVGYLGILVRVPDRRIAWIERPVSPGGEETLSPIRLAADVPISGLVLDGHGTPIAGANVRAFASVKPEIFDKSTTDAMGHFTLYGFGPQPAVQLQIWKPGHVTIDWVVRGGPTGLRWRNVRNSDGNRFDGPARQLTVVMKSEAWIDGRAVDADTGEPVHLDKVIRCSFTRRPGGAIVLNGCVETDFQQQETGDFQVPYDFPEEYHLTFMATGYYDAEALTPPVTVLQPITGIVVKMHKTKEGAGPTVAKEQITGTVTRNGQPVKTGWVGLWRLTHPSNLANASIWRGRTVNQGPIVYACARIDAGSYTLDVPYQDQGWYVVAEEPGQPITQLGPIAVDLNERKKLDIACTVGGSIAGHVEGISKEWAGHVWVVAFTKTGIQVESHVDAQGEFRLKQLSPGVYGLKVGDDAYHDNELNISPQVALNKLAEPWKRAKLVSVMAGQKTSGVQLELPTASPPD